MESEEVNRLSFRPGGADWWKSEFENGRAPFGSWYCAVRRALFESFAPVERALAPVYRFLFRARGSLLRGESVPNRTDVQSMAFDSVLVAQVGSAPDRIGKRPACLRR